MHLSELKLWNFRKYSNSDGSIELGHPHLTVPFKRGLNVLIGENDSGKTSIIDAIKLVMKTHAYEWIHISYDDFAIGTNKLRIELIISGLSVQEASHFTEWLGWTGEEVRLRLVYGAMIREGKIIPTDVGAGETESGNYLSFEAKEYLKTIYLKPLRDADNELTAKKNSRLSQILLGHTLFKPSNGEKHDFVKIVDKANEKIEEWFVEDNDDSHKQQIKDIIDAFLTQFISKDYKSKFSIADSQIKSILEKLSIGIDKQPNLGLGTMNRLYMASELLFLNSNYDGIKLCLIEELEAHLHPQAQMKVIIALQQQKNTQFILSTHSPNLASKIRLSDDNTSIILCKGCDVYPMDKGLTRLADADYIFLEHFLDVTKSNLFFAKGIILVEGWAEEILIPIIAQKLGFDLTEHEISIINVGSTAYLHYAKIFMRNDGKTLDYPVAIVTDKDVPIKKEDGTFDSEMEIMKEEAITKEFFGSANVRVFIATHWTLEWCLYKSKALSEIFKYSCANVHSKTKEFQKNEDGEWNISIFQEKLSSMLRNRSLQKVKIATQMAHKISELETINIDNDDEILYIKEAIKHVCHENRGS